MQIYETLPYNQYWTRSNVPQFIILHHAEASNCTIEDINRWHLQNGWNGGCGYHYLVRKDGSIYRGRPEAAQGAHCPNYNTKSIGICAEGNYMTETMLDVQKNAIIELIQDVKTRYTIQAIYGHGEVYSTECPGKNYPLEDIKNLRAASISWHEYEKEAIVKAQVLCLKDVGNDTYTIVKAFKKDDNITVVGSVTTNNIDFFKVDIDGECLVPMANIDLKEGV